MFVKTDPALGRNDLVGQGPSVRHGKRQDEVCAQRRRGELLQNDWMPTSLDAEFGRFREDNAIKSPQTPLLLMQLNLQSLKPSAWPWNF